METNYKDLEEDKWWEEPSESKAEEWSDWRIVEDMFPGLSKTIWRGLTRDRAIEMCDKLNRGCDAYTSYTAVSYKK